MAFSKKIRIKVHKKYDGHCAYCGEKIELKDMQVDHIIPQFNYRNDILNDFRIPLFLKHLTLDDLNHIDNLNPACRVCNKWKSAHDLELFRSELQDQINRLNKRSANYRMAKRYNQVVELVKPIIFYFESFIKNKL